MKNHALVWPLLTICLVFSLMGASAAWLILSQLGVLFSVQASLVLFGTALVAGLLIWLGGWLWVKRSFFAHRIQEFASQEIHEARETKNPKDEIVHQAPRAYTGSDSATALQMLSILQREGRLVDFLKEDLSSFADAQIGAAVRSVHQGCRVALESYLTLEPVLEQTEGSTVTVEKGFDPSAIRLVGSVQGEPPFQGVLQHGGWRVTKMQLPELLPMQLEQKDWIVAPAEIEMGN